MTLILDGTEESVRASPFLIEAFGNISGLRLNNEKSEALWIGSKRNCNLKLCPEKNFKWRGALYGSPVNTLSQLQREIGKNPNYRGMLEI